MKDILRFGLNSASLKNQKASIAMQASLKPPAVLVRWLSARVCARATALGRWSENCKFLLGLLFVSGALQNWLMILNPDHKGLRNLLISPKVCNGKELCQVPANAASKPFCPRCLPAASSASPWQVRLPPPQESCQLPDVVSITSRDGEG